MRGEQTPSNIYRNDFFDRKKFAVELFIRTDLLLLAQLRKVVLSWK